MSAVAAVALARANRVPYSIRKSLIDHFASPQAVLDALSNVGGVPEEMRPSLSALSKIIDIKEAERIVEKLRTLNVWVKAYRTPEYPRLLSEISDPPFALFGKGTLPPDDAVCLGFVGPRRPSPYGRRIAKWLADDLVREGLVLVSGMARGIDAIAHESALEGKKPTVAVIGCGIDKVYPPEHAYLKDRIEKGGAVVTEFFPGEPALPDHFPRRNRIIAGLSRGVLVVEAGEKSGAKITARHAAEQSRDVFAVPGPIDSPVSMGTNALISEGARLVATSDDVLEGLIPGYKRASQKKDAEKLEANVSPEEKNLLRFMPIDSPVAVDDLAEKIKMPVGAILHKLIELEMKGIVAKQADSRYVRVIIGGG